MDVILEYLRHGTVPTDKKEVRWLVYRAVNFTLIQDVLYKRGRASLTSVASDLRKEKKCFGNHTWANAVTMSSLMPSSLELLGWVITGQPWSTMQRTLCRNAYSIRNMPLKSMLLVTICTLSWIHGLSHNGVWIYRDLFIRWQPINATSLCQLITSQSGLKHKQSPT